MDFPGPEERKIFEDEIFNRLLLRNRDNGICYCIDHARHRARQIETAYTKFYSKKGVKYPSSEEIDKILDRIETTTTTIEL